jgi:HAD superfamily hydrolase (TIGR01509 family)
MTQALLFDFDGLIMDTESTEVQIWREIYADYAAEFPLDVWIREVVGSTDDNFDPAAHLAAITGRTLDLTAIHERARRLRLDRQSRLTALPGVDGMLADASRLGLRLAIVSSSPHWWVDGYLVQLALTDAFERVICREDAAQVKPAPDLYLMALESLGLPAAECLAFEDSPNGMLAARRAGLKVVGVPNPVTAQAGPLPADMVVSSLTELPLEVILEHFDHKGPS